MRMVVDLYDVIRKGTNFWDRSDFCFGIVQEHSVSRMAFPRAFWGNKTGTSYNCDTWHGSANAVISRSVSSGMH
jgi:hypothetical protein